MSISLLTVLLLVPRVCADHGIQDILINDRFRLGRKIGSGGFGVVFTGTPSFPLPFPLDLYSPAQPPIPTPTKK